MSPQPGYVDVLAQPQEVKRQLWKVLRETSPALAALILEAPEITEFEIDEAFFNHATNAAGTTNEVCDE